MRFVDAVAARGSAGFQIAGPGVEGVAVRDPLTAPGADPPQQGGAQLLRNVAGSSPGRWLRQYQSARLSAMAGIDCSGMSMVRPSCHWAKRRAWSSVMVASVLSRERWPAGGEHTCGQHTPEPRRLRCATARCINRNRVNDQFRAACAPRHQGGSPHTSRGSPSPARACATAGWTGSSR